MQAGICFCGVRENFGETQSKLWTITPTWFFQGAVPGMENGRVRDAIRKALASWNPHSALQWREGDDPRSATLRIITERIDGPSNVLADCQLPFPGMTQVLMRLDAEKWTDQIKPTSGTIGLIHTVAHEGGHAMGIGHLPFDSTPDLMNATYSPNIFEPQPDEQVIVRRMYGAPVDVAGNPIPKVLIRGTYPDGRYWEAAGTPRWKN